MENQEVHYCVYCHQVATHQFKNGKWCCSKNQSGCPALKKKISKKAGQKWKQLKKQGITQLKNIPKSKQLTYYQAPIPGICYYCGQPATHQLKNGKWCCSQSVNKCPSLRQKNRAGVLKAYQNGLQERKQLGFTKQSRWNQGKGNRGKTKYNDQNVRQRGERLHQKYQAGLIKSSWEGREHTQEQIGKILYGMSHFRVGKITKGIKHRLV